MFFGDGDGKLLTETTAGIDVIGHELTHGVTQHEANLVYSGQSGALNESISDVFGIQVKQRALGQTVEESDWLIGAEIVGPELSPALRSMKEPGTANPHDDQPADMGGYVDGGDVHVNSGIPNRAFCVVATTLGGHSWEAAGPIWYASLCDPASRRRRRSPTSPSSLCFTPSRPTVNRAGRPRRSARVGCRAGTAVGRPRVRLRIRRLGGIAGVTLKTHVDTAELPAEGGCRGGGCPPGPGLGGRRRGRRNPTHFATR